MSLDDALHSLHENIAAISGDFHSHPRYSDFSEKIGPTINGFTGVYDLCIRMARALTDWELHSGAGTAIYDIVGMGWIDIVQEFVGAMIARSLEASEVPDSEKLLHDLIGAKA